MKHPTTFFFFVLFVLVLLFSGGLNGAGNLQEDDIPQSENTDSRIVWMDSLEPAMRKSRLGGQFVLVKFEAEWCEPCRKLSAEFAKKEFEQTATQFIRVKIDVDRNSDIAQHYNISQIPALLVLNSRGKVLGEKTGSLSLAECVKWLANVEDADLADTSEMLTSTEKPTRTEIAELVSYLGQNDQTVRQLSIQRLSLFPETTVSAVIEVFVDGKLASKLAAFELLQRWRAPVEKFDPWRPESFTKLAIADLEKWAESTTNETITSLAKLEPADIENADTEIEQLLAADGDYLNQLAGMTRYGTGLLPVVYKKIIDATSDADKERLTALRYWLVASNKMRLEWAGGLIELSSRNLESRRAAAAALVDLTSSDDEALLLEIFTDSDPFIRELSLKALNQIGMQSTNQALARLLTDPDANVKAAVLKQLAETPSTRMIATVAEYLDTETDYDLIVYALKFLKEAGGKEAVNSVLKLASHKSWQVRAQVAEVLATADYDELDSDTSEQVSQTILKLLVDPDGYVVSKAIEGLPPARTKKTIKQMIDIARQHPELAGQIAESIAGGSSSYGGFGSSSNKSLLAVPHFKDFLTNKNAEIRTAGVTGLASVGLATLDDKYSTLLTDEETKVRIAATTALTLRITSKRTQEIEKNKNSGGASAVRARSNSSISSLMSRISSHLFGEGSNNEKLGTIELEEHEQSLDLAEDLNAENDPIAADGLSDDGSDAENSAPDKETDLPELHEEAWLINWIAQKDQQPTWMTDAAEILNTMLETDDETEQVAAAYGLTVLGRHDAVAEMLKQKPADDEAWYELGAKSLPWLTFEARTELFESLISTEQFPDKIESAVTYYAEVRNPAAAKMIWQATSLAKASPQYVLTALSSAYFGSGNSSYTSLEDSGVDDRLVKLAVGDINKVLSKGNESNKLLALALLYKTKDESLKSHATAVFESTGDPALRKLALRVLLLIGSTDESQASKLLDSADADSIRPILQFLAFGASGIAQSELEGDIYLYDEGSSHSYFGDPQDSVKVRVPKPPSGLQSSAVAKWLTSDDDEIKALATYQMVLLQEEVDTLPLLNYWKSNQDEESVAVMMYKAIAVLDDDELSPTLTKIYETHGKDNPWFSAGFYWTIRPMSGARVIKLRSRVRKEIGIQQLNSYN